MPAVTVTLRRFALPVLGLGALLGGLLSFRVAAAPAARTTTQADVPTLQAVPRNVVLILSDDHRYDLMGFMERAPEWLETPNLDRMRAQGAHVRNAFVTTAPDERHNLIGLPTLQHTVRAMRDRLFDRLEATGGMQIPVRRGNWQADRKPQ